jgi:hypothetical protein
MIQSATQTRTDPRKAQFVAELVANGGNASAAARAVGWHPDTGRRLVSRDATIRATLQQVRKQAEGELQDWANLAGRAQHVLAELLDAEDSRVRLMAALAILERALGRVPQKVEQRVEHRAILKDVEMQAAISLVAEHGLSFTEAVQYVREHPEEVQEWARQNVAPTRSDEAPVESSAAEGLHRTTTYPA